MNDNDFGALDYLNRRYTQTHKAEAVRFAIVQQSIRDGDEGKMSEAEHQRGVRIKESVTGMLTKSLNYGADEVRMKPWMARLTGELVEHRDRIKKSWGFDKDAEAIRFAIRMQAEIDGFKPKDDKWATEKSK